MWCITKDKINDDMDRTGKVSYDWNSKRAKLPMTRFRLLDDDRNIYYYGRMPSEDINADEEIAFAPLDWAEADAGCTIMQWYNKNTKKWETM